MRNAFVDALLAGGGEELLVLSGDAGLGVFDRLRQESPDRFLNLGVAEQNMAGMAAGLALTGRRVLLYNIIPFLLYRCYEQLRNDICGQGLPVILAGIGSGVTYAPAGMSHYAVEDLGVAATLPALAVYSPCDRHEAVAAARHALAADGPVYVRLAKTGEPPVHPGPVAGLSSPLTVREGEDCVLFFHGSIGPEVTAAADRLAERGISAAAVSVPRPLPLDEEGVLAAARGKRLAVAVEEHFESTGLGCLLASLAARRSPGWRLERRGIPPRFLHEVNDPRGMRERFGLAAERLARDVEGWLRG